MDTNRRAFTLGLGSAVAWPALGGLTTAAYAQTPVKGGTVRIFLSEPTGLVSAISSAGPIAQISPKLFEGLVVYDADMKMQPRMAKSVVMSADGKTLTIVLREGLKWHDGKPITSADVAFSATKVWSKFHSRGRSTYAALTGVDTPDGLTAVFNFSTPSAFVMNALFASEAQVVPKHIYDGTDILKNPTNTAPIGSGPFKFVEWKQGEYILLEKNPHYWAKDEPLADQIVVLLVPDSSARAIAFEAQEVDAAGGIPVSLAEARRLEKLPYIDIPDKGYQAYGNNCFMEVNVRRPALSDVRVRRAILHALDRDFMLKNVFFNFGNVATGPVPSGISAFYTTDVPAYPFDMEKSKALLDEAGLVAKGRGIRLTLTLDPPTLWLALSHRRRLYQASSWRRGDRGQHPRGRRRDLLQADLWRQRLRSDDQRRLGAHRSDDRGAEVLLVEEHHLRRAVLERLRLLRCRNGPDPRKRCGRARSGKACRVVPCLPEESGDRPSDPAHR